MFLFAIPTLHGFREGAQCTPNSYVYQLIFPARCRYQPVCVYMEYKTDWAADLKDSLIFFSKSTRSLNENLSIEGLEQVYGYMPFNNNKYNSATGRVPDFCVVQKQAITGNWIVLVPSSWTVLLAENDWFYASLALDLASPNRFCLPTRTELREHKKAITICGRFPSS